MLFELFWGGCMAMEASGLFTAVVTPFSADGSGVDYAAFGRLLDMQIDNWASGVVVCGSTGEGATTSAAEKSAMIEFAVERADGRCWVVAGVGSNDTRTAAGLMREAAAAGADGALAVNPYYSKPSEEGVFAHFAALADASDLPLMLYNVPGRTGSNMSAELQLRLSEEIGSVFATKEASGDLNQIMELIDNGGPGFSVMAGDDALALATIACGGTGVVSVVGNVAPGLMWNCVNSALRGGMEMARVRHYELLPLMQACFWASNPIPIKTLLSLSGVCLDSFRLPLVGASAELRERLRLLALDYDLI